MTTVFPTEARIYVDTNIWIYFLEGQPTFAESVRKLLVAADDASATLCTSDIAVAECLLKPVRLQDERKIAAFEALFDKGEIELLPVDGALCRRAAYAGGALGLKLIDAIHYVSAREAGCQYFLTADTRFKSSATMAVIGLN
jgi:predicted nucleic acid-binding protein